MRVLERFSVRAGERYASFPAFFRISSSLDISIQDEDFLMSL